LRRREGKDRIEFPAPAPEHGPADELKQVLGKTLGVPLFQEQAMRLAIEAAKFTDAEANGLRRAMATFRHYGSVGVYGQKFVEGMVSRGYDVEFAQRCFKQIEGFGSYGFPESHAISFALLVYASSWIKWAYPDAFCAALINSQPMGFYQPAQLVRDAREHGVEVRAPCILASDWDCTLEEAAEVREERPHPHGRTGPLKAVRLGFRQIRGLKEEEVRRLIDARVAGARTIPDLARRGRLSRRTLELLAEADVFRSLGLSRRDALWAVKGLVGEAKVETDAPLLARMGVTEAGVALPDMALPQHVAEDYRTLSLSLKAHPVTFFREQLAKAGAVPCSKLTELTNGRRVAVGGLVLIRQRPGTAKGVTFLTLEDETGPANIVVWKDVFERHRKLVMTSSFIIVRGKLQREGEVIHLVADQFVDLSSALSQLREDETTPRVRSKVDGGLIRSRDFH
ncbi:OB-fold nucleic acid binding domain-containing protein, partial [Phenylobacterium sp.]|uniref:helix-hairpin-helix domain-containing protein n=1 Tax=Phenylobacterium sp. TaxID=1871053 RepID=UPI002E316906